MSIGNTFSIRSFNYPMTLQVIKSKRQEYHVRLIFWVVAAVAFTTFALLSMKYASKDQAVLGWCATATGGCGILHSAVKKKEMYDLAAHIKYLHNMAENGKRDRAKEHLLGIRLFKELNPNEIDICFVPWES